MDRRTCLIGALSGGLTVMLDGCSRSGPDAMPRAETVTVPTAGRAAQLLAAAHTQQRNFVHYEPGYQRIGYPGGDLPADHGACTDVLIRA